MSDETVLSDEERFESLLAAEEQPIAEVPVDAGETVEEETEEIEGEELEASEDQLDDEDATEEEPETEEPVDDGVIEFALQNGEVIRTTKDDLAGSYLRQSDYTRKM